MAGVQFAADETGRRSSSRLARHVVAAALASVDPVGSTAAERETAWRTGYVDHFRRLVEAGLDTPERWDAIAAAGLSAVRTGLVAVDDTDIDQPLSSLLEKAADRSFATNQIDGTAGREAELVLPYRGQQLRGEELLTQLDVWTTAGVMEPSAADAIGWVLKHPESLRLEGFTVAVLGAGAQMGPLPALLRWGATVAALDVPNPEIWQRLLAQAEQGAGRLVVPATDSEQLGADLLTDIPAVAGWLAQLPGKLVIGNYTYADGGTHVRLSAAVDLLIERVRQQRSDVALAFLATPTDVFVVPEQAVVNSISRYDERSRLGKLAGRPLRAVSRGKLLHRAYLPGTDVGICDALVPVQGPNYALAKRIQRWRASIARAEGAQVSFNVAPSTRTRSVVKNRALAAAYAGAHRFGVEIFEPDTANTLMAALLVYDLNVAAPELDHSWRHEAHDAVHGGLWRAPYAPRSALGVAAVLGYAAARN